MADAVRIKGLKELTRSLKAFDKEVGKLPQKVNKKAAALVATTARGKAPHRSGRLAGSLRPGATGVRAYVRSSLIYAPVQHFGWPRHHIKAKPFLYQALEEDTPKIIDLYVTELNTELSKVRGI